MVEYLDIKEVQKMDRYKDFTILEKPMPLNAWLKDAEYTIVQVHSIIKSGESILGFCGVFSWENNILSPIDGDTYDSKMMVYGFKKFTTKNIENGLDILVKDW